MKRTLRPLILALWLAGAVGVSAADLLGTNGLSNGGFEDAALGAGWQVSVTGTGATATLDTRIVSAGQRSLRLAAPESPASITLASAAVPVEPGEQFLFSLARRQAGFNRKPAGENAYEGVAASMSLLWLNENRRQVRADGAQWGFPYAALPWEITDALVQPPPGARFVVVQVYLSNDSGKTVGQNIPSTLWLDAVQLRRYHPPPTPPEAAGATPRIVEGASAASLVRAYFLASDNAFENYRGGQWSQVALDPDAERGSALQARPNAGEGIMAHSPHFAAPPPGLYRLRMRIKVSDPAAAQDAGLIDIVSGDTGMRLQMPVTPRTFARAGVYQTVEADYILRGISYWAVRVFTKGAQTWSIDSIKIIPLAEFEDRQLAAIYPGSTGEIDANLRPRKSGPMRVLIVAGPGYDAYRLQDILRVTDGQMEIDSAWTVQSQTPGITGYPETAAQLFDHSAVFLCNVPARMLDLGRKAVLREYVRRGGILVVFGGHQAYERGGWRGSLLEETLPVTVAPSLAAGLVHQPAGEPVRLAPDVAWLREIDLTQAPRVYFRHQAQLKPGARVFATAGNAPLVVGGDFGDGRVVCVLGAPYGMAARAGQTPFWKWSDWPYLMRESLWWAMHRQE